MSFSAGFCPPDTVHAVDLSLLAGTAEASQSLAARSLEFIVRRRVPISIALFGGLVIKDLVSGVVPHDILDATDLKAMLGLAGVLAGLALRSWAAGFLVKDTVLTTGGPYAVVRNPLYLGSFLMVGGFCLLFDDLENIFILPGAMLLIYWPKVYREEHGLAERFPEAWPQYAARTSRFFPRLTQRPQFSGWMLSQWLQSREYNAVVTSLAALVGLKLLRLILLIGHPS